MPAKLLEVNRKVINGYLGRTRGGKVSFTHLIGYAVVRAIADAMPVMNSSYAEADDGKPAVVRHEHVGLGLAVDVEKSDGSRTLLVPCIKHADTLDFRAFLAAYEDLIRKVRSNKLSPDDFAGATVTLTNPGTIGTVQSVPRLMPGQGVIVGVGAIDYPAEYQAADPRALADLGVSKVMTITSTYDHRIIQGAESGLFLKQVHELLLGEDGFYDDVFRSLGVPYEAVEWRRDVNPVDRDDGDPAQADAGARRSSTCTGSAATSSPTSTRWRGRSRTCTPSSTRPPTGSPSGTSTASSSPTAWPARDRMRARRDPRHPARRLLPHHRRRVHAHPGARPEALDPGARRGRVDRARRRRAAPHPRAAQRRRGVRDVPRHQVRRARSASASRAPSRPSRCSTPSSSGPPTTASTAR